MVLSLLGKLVDPTNQYTSYSHLVFSQCLVWVITLVVGNVTTTAFALQGIILVGVFIRVIDPYAIPGSGILTFFWIWSLVEVIFYFYCVVLKKKLDRPMTLPSLTKEEKLYFLDKVLAESDNPSSALIRWFHLNSEEDYGIECLTTWLSWAFFGKLETDLMENEREEVGILVSKIVQKCPEISKPAKKNPAEFMRLHLDDVAVQHKPFVAYVVISGMRILGTLFLSHIGFKHHKFSGESRLSYWTYDPQISVSGTTRTQIPESATLRKRQNSDSDSTRRQNPESDSVRKHQISGSEAQSMSDSDSDSTRPIFIVHGIGIGIAMYFKLVQAVVKENPGRRIFLLELPHISLKVLDRIPSIEETLEAIDEIFEHHNIQTCSWLAHSYGTIVTTWILKERPSFVSKITYVDPVCFALWEPDLIYNFLYKVPPSPIHRLCQFFVAQDLVVASTLFRNFSWLRNILFPDDIPCPANVFISSHDFIIDPYSIYRYLDRYNRRVKGQSQPPTKGQLIGVKIMDGLSHGSVLNSSENIALVVKHI